MSSWRRLHARYDAPETTGSVLRLHRGPLGFVVKIWDHLGPVFPSDHRFSGGGDGSEIGVGAPKTRISENPISTRKQVECCSTRWVLVKSSQTMTKLHSRFRIPPLTSKIMVQKSALELQKREFPKIQSRLAKRVESCSARWVLVDIVTNHAKTSLKVQNSASNIQNHGSEIGVGAKKMWISENPISAGKRMESCFTKWVLVKIVTNHGKTSLKVQNSAHGIENHGSKNLFESPKMPKSRSSFKMLHTNIYSSSS